MQTKSNAGAGAPPAGRARAQAATLNIDGDRRLLRLAEGYRRVELELAKIECGGNEAPVDAARDRRLELCVRLQGNFARETLSAPATTLAGAAAKLEVAAAWFRSDLEFIGGAPITHNADEALVAIVDELAALGWSSAALASAPGHRKAPAEADALALAGDGEQDCAQLGAIRSALVPPTASQPTQGLNVEATDV